MNDIYVGRNLLQISAGALLVIQRQGIEVSFYVDFKEN